MSQLFKAIRNFLSDRFSLHDDKADAPEIIESITRNIEFKGTNLWALIFAIFIASIGLNVNSTAVIIGAMLISPIMGPIMGIGLGIGINDIELIRKAGKNLGIAAVISIIVSAFYFLISPLQEAQSELLARTTPSIWDVFIAFFGGLAGIVAGTRKEKSNVIPGVAIATALMPPLCTAGFGLAKGNVYFFLGALYLFFINSVFICISSYLIVRYLHLPKKEFENIGREKKVTRYIMVIVLLTAMPSVYLAYRIVRKSIFETNANLFVRHEFQFKNTFVINKSFKYADDVNEIDLLLFGEDLSAGLLDSLEKKLPGYHLGNTKLIVHQGLNAKQQIDFAEIKASVLEEVSAQQNYYRKAMDKTAVAAPQQDSFPDLRKELKILYPNLIEYSIARSVIKRTDTVGIDTVALFLCKFSKKISHQEASRLRDWLQSRININKIKVIVE